MALENQKRLSQVNVVIDAGHGGSDNGANVDGVTEKKIVEQLIYKIQALNKNKNIIIHFTRSADQFIPLDDRTTFINTIKPDLVLSLHVNSSINKNFSGIEFYVSKESTNYNTSNLIAEKFQTKFLNANYKVAEIKNANFYILKKSEVPALTLEMGFISNQNDRNYITSEEGQNQIAQTILNFVSGLK